MALAPCLACETEISAGLRVCPECGYDLERHDRARRWLGAIGMATALSGVLAPVGVPMLWRAYRHRLAAAGSVTRHVDPAPAEHVRRAMRDSIGFGRWEDTSERSLRPDGGTGSLEASHEPR